MALCVSPVYNTVFMWDNIYFYLNNSCEQLLLLTILCADLIYMTSLYRTPLLIICY